MNRACLGGVAGVGCVGVGCVVVVIAFVIGGVALLVLFIFASVQIMPHVVRTPAGISVTNKMSDDLIDSKITVHASRVGKPGLAADFILNAPDIGAHKTVIFPFRQFHSRSGIALNPSKFDPTGYTIKFHDADGSHGSFGGGL